MRISDWSSDVCSSDLRRLGREPADAAALCGTGDRRGPRHSGQRAAAADREPDRRLEAETSMTQSAVSVRGVTQHFTADGQSTLALDAIDLDIPHGKFVAPGGPTGGAMSQIGRERGRARVGKS